MKLDSSHPAPTEEHCDIMDLCQALIDEGLAAIVTSYGIGGEYVFDVEKHRSEEPPVTVGRSPKPRRLFRGQNSVYHTLQATIFRDYGLACSWQKELRLQIGNKALVMPHPHYSAALECDFYYSCVKALEIRDIVKRQWPGYSDDQVDSHALGQHYGLATHFLDFSEDVWTAGFFASHTYPEFQPLADGVGVLYVLDRERLPENVCYEIGIQPLERPFAQRGWLVRTHPGLNMAHHPSVRPLFFRHRKVAGERLAKRFAGGEQLVPTSDIAASVLSCLGKRYVKRHHLDRYLDVVREHGGPAGELKEQMAALFRQMEVHVSA